MLHPRWPWRLNKHPEVICVHLGLLFSSPCSSSSSHQGAALELAALFLLLSASRSRSTRSHGRVSPPGGARSGWEILRCTECDQPGPLISLSSPPLICLRHHSLGAGRHSLHQACANISQASAPICISPSPITTSAFRARRHVRTHGMRSQTASRRPRTCSCVNNQNQCLPHANECKPGLHA